MGDGSGEMAMKRTEMTTKLTNLLERHVNPKNDPRIYTAEEVTFDYSTNHAVRVDFMRFNPVNNSVSGIEKGDVYCYEVKSSVEDFRSGHGLNFLGDYNYLVMPFDVYEVVKHEIPYYVGVLALIDDGLKIVHRVQRHNRMRPICEVLLMMYRSTLREVLKANKAKITNDQWNRRAGEDGTKT